MTIDDEIERILILYAADIYKLAGAKNSNFIKPETEAHNKIKALVIAARLDEQRFHVGGWRNLSCEACGAMLKQNTDRIIKLQQSAEQRDIYLTKDASLPEILEFMDKEQGGSNE